MIKTFPSLSPAFCASQAPIPCIMARIWAEIWMEELCQAETPAQWELSTQNSPEFHNEEKQPLVMG